MKKVDVISGAIVLLAFLAIFFFFRNMNKLEYLSPKNSQSAVKSDSQDQAMNLTSSAFEDGQSLPQKYTCDGDGVNPPLMVGNIPEAAKTLAIVLEDPDAPGGTFTHWILWNIDPTITNIPENSSGGEEGENDFGNPGYGAPCPLKNGGAHHYTFKVMALDEEIDFPPGVVIRRSDFDKAISGHVLDSAQITGMYSR